MVIDYVALNQLPTHGCMFGQLRGYDENNDDNDEAHAGVGENEPGLEQGNVTGDVHGDETLNAIEAHAVRDPGQQSQIINQGTLDVLNRELHQNETCNKENLGTVNNSMPLTGSASRLNDCNHPCMQSFALFPYSRIGDVNNSDRFSKVKIKNILINRA